MIDGSSKLFSCSTSLCTSVLIIAKTWLLHDSVSNWPGNSPAIGSPSEFMILNKNSILKKLLHLVQHMLYLDPISCSSEVRIVVLPPKVKFSNTANIYVLLRGTSWSTSSMTSSLNGLELATATG